MRGWSTLTLLIALLCVAASPGGDATAQPMQGAPPPPPGNDQHGPPLRGPWPPPPPQSDADSASANPDRRPPLPPPLPPPPPPQQTPIAAPMPPTAPTAAVTVAPTADATIPAEAPAPGVAPADVWPPPAEQAASSSTAAAQPGSASPAVAASTSATATEPSPAHSFPRDEEDAFRSYWPWLLALALSIVLLFLSMTLRRAMRLKGETERLTRHQRMLQNVNRNLHDESEQLRHLAINDPLTGTLNRRAFADELRTLLDHLARFGRPLNLIVFDLDHFKAINDRQGHLAGDAALKLVAGIVRKNLSSDDLFGRFGGDEFLIACADKTLEETAALADGIRCAVIAESVTCDPPLPGLSLSIGIARASPESDYFVDGLFQRADTALYTAKHGGRNRVVLANDDLPHLPASAATARQLA